ncbi:nucleotidyl transferase AbiEii/AbiGii toxin family protein [Wenzhouxiangella sp. EGI_FJ10305]|uniref:nucleotidyl transferase AbiEii/AbiGii toxin family protein n=1 Tax=Wenzhouxiangella sp. EGI_FJ10305 TaxID=3243768 RepID=UPI0035DFCDF5
MTLSAESLNRLAGETGFRIEFLEKVDRLVELLQALFDDPFLASRLTLKGGTALNLFHFGLPRLSVDIDLNYIGALDREKMLGERPQIEQRIQAIAGRHNLSLIRAPSSHAGCKWSFRYSDAFGGGGTLEVDLNYLYRQPLWPLQRLDSQPLGTIVARGIPVLDIHELAGGKLAALFSRTAARDLFDAHHLLTVSRTDPSRLRAAFILYGAMNRRDWRTITLDDVDVGYRDARRNLFPLLVQHQLTRRKEQEEMLERLIGETRQALASLLPLDEIEHEFLHQLIEKGSIRPDLLELEPELAAHLDNYPALQWRAQQAQR